jgi:hypothetical protein
MKIKNIERTISGAILAVILCLGVHARGQQAQTQQAPIVAENAKYTQGVGPGYWPKANGGLVLSLTGGTANCGGTVVQYTAGTLTMTPSTTNYVYLNTAASCVPAVKTSSFTSSDIPIAVVVASSSGVTSILDDRTMFNLPGAGGGSGITSLTGDGTATGPGAAALTLASVTSAACPTIGSNILCWNSKGLILSYGAVFAATFSCTQCGTYETGYAGITAVSGGVSYTNPSTPTSASVSDGTNTDTLTTPFTSWGFSNTYTTNTTFTLTTTGASQTINRTQSLVFLPRVFGGVGTAGATGATASGTSAVLVGATGTLASAGLSASQVGQTFGPYSPSGQKVYLLLIGCGHTTFKDVLTGFAFIMNAGTPFTFVNANGSSITMCDYESVNTLTGSYEPQAVN